MADSSRAGKTAKPRSARKDFPLFIHKGTNRWCKKVAGRHVYFGKVDDDPDGEAALRLWLDQRDDLLAGRKPRAKADTLRLVDLVNAFLTYKSELLASGELTQRTFDGYKAACQQLVDILGKERSAPDIGPDDFQKVRAELARRYKPVGLTNRIQVVRSVFKYGYDSALLEKPARFGLFKKPRAKVIREARLAKGAQDFTAGEVRRLLDHATVNLRGMILLGVQAGFGGHDCATLTIDAVDWDRGWIDWPRAKTATHRRVPLWPETIAALREARGQHDGSSSLVFMGRRGVSYVSKNGGYRVAREFDRVAKAAGVEGRGFYSLRRTFQTVGEDARDLVAVQSIMGHIPPETDMSARYRQRVSDDRLRAVTDHVHSWLWPRPMVFTEGGVK